MQWKTRIVAAAVMCLALPAQAFACYMPKFISRNSVPAKMNYEGGLGIYPGDYLGLVVTGAVNLPVGGKGVVSPLVGFCKYSSESELLFGAAVAWEIWKDATGNATANLQSGLSYQSFDGGSDIIIPLGASYSKKMSDKMAWYALGTLLVDMYKITAVGQSYSETEMDPAVSGGVVMKQGAMDITAGAALKLGEGTDFAITLGVSTSGAANAIRRIGSTIIKK